MTHLNRRDFFLYTIAFLLPFLSACLITAYTGSIWEDGLITLRQAMNWVDGQGLTYNFGERVHGFTSPLNVLLLAFFYKLFGTYDPLNGLYGYRALSIFLLGATGIWVIKIFRWSGDKSILWPLLTVLLFSLDTKTMLFSTNGQESAFTVFFLATGMAAALCSRRSLRIPLLIFAIAGLQWNRPEGFIYSSGLIAGDLLRLATDQRMTRLKEYLWIVPCSVLAYLPWLLFTFFYYGSPIPNTIYAKGGSSTLSMFSAKMLSAPWEVAASALAPINFQTDNSLIVSGFSALLVFFVCGYFFVAGKDARGRIAAACAIASFVYLCLVDAMSHNYPWPRPFAWYYPPLSFCVIVAVASSFSKIAGPPHPLPFWKRIGLATTTSVIFSMLLFFCFNDCQAIRNLQATVENGVRKPIGIWLKENTRPGDTVYCECIGYIGFYSGAIITDYPGLTSRKIAEVRRRKNLDFYGLLDELQSTWLILRFNEARDAQEKGLLKNYTWVRDFATGPELNREQAPQSSSFDSYFRVFKHKDSLP